MTERLEGRGMDPAIAPPELVSLDRRLLARLREVSDDEETYFGGRRARPEAARIGEEHAALAEAAARSAGGPLAGAVAPRILALVPGGQASNVVPLHGANWRPNVRAG